MISIAVNDQSQVSEARRAATKIAEENGFGTNDAGRVSLVTTELATNLLKHGGGGEVLAGAYDDGQGQGRGVEVLALDRGRGMTDIAACLRDGFSSAGTQGNGLGGVVRQSHFIDIASWPGLGTAILARIETGRADPESARPHPGWGAVSVAMPGETVCGDSWTVAQNGGEVTLLVADGLGHGQDAAEASVEAVRLFHRFGAHQVPTLLDYIHGGLRATRGAAVSLARFDPGRGHVTFAGVGNVAGTLAANGQLKRMVSMPGTAGHNARKIQSFEYPFTAGLVILHSDGLSASWNLTRYTNLHLAHPTLIAGVLYRDFSRRRDDATVLVGKWLVPPI